MSKKKDVVVKIGKKKSAKARATIKKGKGEIKINSKPLNVWGSTYERGIIADPFSLIKDKIKDLDIKVKTWGGGKVSQAAAARVAIARGVVDWTNDKKIKKILTNYDDKILSGDARQREPNKPNRSSPRARKQKSYR
ncbi:MAG: 30S ribosomal protein S9 [Candidatus Undinarchaeales archaeon]